MCPNGAKGANGTGYICTNGKWVPILVDSCAGWDCTQDGQLCPQGASGAGDTSYVCQGGKWKPASCDAAAVGGSSGWRWQDSFFMRAVNVCNFVSHGGCYLDISPDAGGGSKRARDTVWQSIVNHCMPQNVLKMFEQVFMYLGGGMVTCLP